MEVQLVQNVNVVFGPGCIADLPEILEQKGAKRPLIVTDKGIVAAGIVDKVAAALGGCEPVVFGGVEPDPSAEVVDAGFKLFGAEGCDIVIGVGGGSAMDTAKAVNLLRYNEGPILRYAKGEAVASSPDLVVVPTTSGTGSELSDGLVISGPDGVKYPVLATLASAEYAVVDPELMVGMPPHITASTGVDALAHNVEGFTTTVATMVTDHLATGTIQSIIEWLPRAVADGSDIEARSHMAVNCLMGGWMLRQAHTHAGHSVAHVLGAHFHIPHGFACAYALPWVIEFNAPAVPEKTAQLARWFGAEVTGEETPEEVGAKARDAIRSFTEGTLGLKPVNAWEIDRSQFAAMAKDIEGELFQVFNPRKMTAADAEAILEKIFA